MGDDSYFRIHDSKIFKVKYNYILHKYNSDA